MFLQRILFLSALALAGAAVMDLGKREEYEVDGPAILNQSNCCMICRDPEVLTYDLRKIRVQYPCMYNLTADLDNIVQVFMLTKPTGFNKRSLIVRVDIVYKGVNYSFSKGDCAERFFMVKDLPGVYVPIPFDNADVHIYAFEIDNHRRMIFKIKAFYFVVSWDCHSCLYICVGPNFYNRMDGLCGNNNDDPDDDDWGQPNDAAIANMWEYYPCPPNGGYIM